MSDRGMKKWAPYKSLPEQEKYLKKLKEEQEKPVRPVMSSDEMEEINEILVNYAGEEVLITYWRNEKINSSGHAINFFVSPKGDNNFFTSVIN